MLACDIILAPLLLFATLQGELVLYGIGQAKGQMAIVWNARPIEEVLADPAFPDSLKKKLELIQEIKRFAFDSLGINPTDNYSTFFDQHGQSLLWVVTAAEPYALKAKEWTFPVIGSVSYKGFFDKGKAEAEEMELAAEGYDTDIGKVGGWSTLGWFRDPVLSSMLYNSEGELANLIIHELTHGTLYVKDDVDFNENLASFIGDKGAIMFLEYKFGKDSREYREYMGEDSDEGYLNDYALDCVDRADSLYKSFKPGDSEEMKAAKKTELLRQFARGLYALPFTEKDRSVLKRINKRLFLSKNALLMTFVRYDSEQDDFEKEFTEKFNSDVRLYLNYLKKIYPNV